MAASSPAYPAPLRLLHWLMALLILTAIALGVWAIYLPRGTGLRPELLNLHKSIGVTVLALIVVRVGVRIGTSSPPYRPPLTRLNSIASHAAHGLLYLLMIVLPVSGYVFSMAGKHGFDWFGLFPVPNVVPPSETAAAGAEKAHYVFAIAIGVVLTAHILAAIWHAAIKRDAVLARMWPSAARG